MKSNRIHHAATNVCGVTYSQPLQVVIIEVKNKRIPYYGYFEKNSLSRSEGNYVTNKWNFHAFIGGAVQIDGNDIISITLYEEGRILYYIDDVTMTNFLYSSMKRETAHNYCFTIFQD
jgi:hypothetical protein